MFCLLAAAVAKGEVFKRLAPEMTVYEPDGAHIFFAPDVPASAVKLLAKISLEQLKSQSFPSIYKIPLARNLYLVTVSRSQGLKSNYILFKEEANRLVELKRTAEVDNTIVGTTFFVGKSRVLFAAETALPPDFSGLEIYDFSKNDLRHLGQIALAEKVKLTGLDGDFVSPVAKLRVEYASNTYRLTASGNLYSEWGGGAGEEIKSDSPITYLYNGKFFERQRVKSAR